MDRGRCSHCGWSCLITTRGRIRSHATDGLPCPGSGEAPAPGDSVPPLSKREIEVVVGYADGLKLDDVAKRLYISASTVKFHMAEIKVKLGARNPINAVAVAFQRGILVQDPQQFARVAARYATLRRAGQTVPADEWIAWAAEGFTPIETQARLDAGFSLPDAVAVRDGAPAVTDRSQPARTEWAGHHG